MKRRNFLKLTTPLAITPFVLNGLPYRTFATPNMIASLDCDAVGERVLVLLQMAGGNDGLNTIIPVNQYDVYANIRPTIAIPQPGASPGYIDLDSTLPLEDQVGLHPGMTDIKDLYDQGKVNIIQAVSYDSQNLSHFKSTDLYLTGGDGTPENFHIPTGWMGRFLDHQYPGLAGNPTDIMPDPLGIQLGNAKPSLGFHTEGEHATGINLTGQNPEGFYDLVSEIGGPHPVNIPETEYGDEMQYIMNVENSTSNYAQRITEVFNAGSNAGAYPNTNLAGQLKTIARLISGGSKTKIFLVNIGGFDTHINQVEISNPIAGWHNTLLSTISQAVKAFQDDLNGLGLEERVMTVTFSEFGRKAYENGSFGTDHGTLAPMLLFGSAVNPGITGTNVNLSDLNGEQLKNHQHDYRQVFTTLLQDWLGASDDAIFETQFQNYLGEKLPFVHDDYVVGPECYLAPLPIELSFFTATLVNTKEVLIEWKTDKEVNSDYFEIERSADGQSFDSIMEVQAAGDSNFAVRYSEIDEQPLNGTSYYRLKQVDQDGKYSFSEIRVIEIKEENLYAFKVYPNPARYDINLVLTANKACVAHVKIVDVMGKPVQTRNLSVKEGFNKYNFNISNFSSGTYILLFESKSLYFSKSIKFTVKK